MLVKGAAQSIYKSMIKDLLLPLIRATCLSQRFTALMKSCKVPAAASCPPTTCSSRSCQHLRLRHTCSKITLRNLLTFSQHCTNPDLWFGPLVFILSHKYALQCDIMCGNEMVRHLPREFFLFLWLSFCCFNVFYLKKQQLKLQSTSLLIEAVVRFALIQGQKWHNCSILLLDCLFTW